MSGKRLKKSQWLPLMLALYAMVISCVFGPKLIAEGLAAKFWISVAVEAIVVVGLFFALKKKESLARK